MMNNDPEYAAASRLGLKAVMDAFRSAPQTDGRFAGTETERDFIVGQIKSLFDDPGEDPVYLKRGDTIALADDLRKTHAHWSIGQYSQALGTLLDPERS